MKRFAAHLYTLLFHLGGFGALGLGILDSSFLVMPLANDILIVGLTARRHIMLPYYAFMASAGSVLGCALTDAISRKGGEEGLGKHVSARRLEYVKKKVKKSAAWALAVASLMPPPFPFTPFVAAAAALQYPRQKLLTVIGISRFIRFSAVGLLAVFFGTRILELAKSPVVQGGILAIIALSVGASTVSVYSWVKRSRGSSGASTLKDRAA